MQDNEESQAIAMPAKAGQHFDTKEIDQAQLPVSPAKPPHRTRSLRSLSPMSPKILRRSQSQDENISTMGVRFVAAASCVDREAVDCAARDISGAERSGSSTFKQHERTQFHSCLAKTSMIFDRKHDSTCGLRRRNTDPMRITRSANGIILRRNSSTGSERATIEIWDPWRRASISPLMVAEVSKTSLSRHHNVPCVEIGTKTPRDEIELAFDVPANRQKAAIAPQLASSLAQSEDLGLAKPDCAATITERNDSALTGIRVDSISDIELLSTMKDASADGLKESQPKPRDSSLPKLLSGPSSPSEVANTSEQISRFDCHTRQSGQGHGVPSDENELHRDLKPQELDAAIDQDGLSSVIEPDQDFTTQFGARKPRQSTSTPEQMEKFRRLWKDDRGKRGFVGETKAKIRNVFSKMTRFRPGTQDQNRGTILRAALPKAPKASLSFEVPRRVVNDLATIGCDANPFPGRHSTADFAPNLRDLVSSGWNSPEHKISDRRCVQRKPVLPESSPENGEIFELPADLRRQRTKTGAHDASRDKSPMRSSSFPVSPTAVLFTPAVSPLPPIPSSHTSLTRAGSVSGTSSTARHEFKGSPLPPMPPQPQLKPQDFGHSRRAFGSSSTYHSTGPYIYNEGHMRSLADFSLSEIQRYWLRAQADARADVMEGWMPLGL
jgi:hypothetical protein